MCQNLLKFDTFILFFSINLEVNNLGIQEIRK